jgi:hypothetical protein
MKWANAIVALALVTTACSGSPNVPSDPEGDASQAAYDEGYVFGGSALCTSWEVGFGTPEVKANLPASQVIELVGDWNELVGEALTTNGATEQESLTYISGMWDGATLKCPQWFPTPEIAGRPGGGDVQPVPQTLPLDELRSIFAQSAAQAVSSNYPRTPTGNELLAISRFYDDWNASSSNPDSLRGFFLRTNHPILNCGPGDMDNVLLPDWGDPTWDDPTTLVPVLDTATMIEDHPSLGPVATVERKNVDGFNSDDVHIDYFYLVGGVAYGYHKNCGSAVDPPSFESELYQGAERSDRSLNSEPSERNQVTDPPFPAWLTVDAFAGFPFDTTRVADVVPVVEQYLGPSVDDQLVNCPGGDWRIVSWDTFSLNFEDDLLVGWYYVGSDPALTTPSGTTSYMTLNDVYGTYGRASVEVEETTLGWEFSYLLNTTSGLRYLGGILTGPDATDRVDSLFAGLTCFWR